MRKVMMSNAQDARIERGGDEGCCGCEGTTGTGEGGARLWKGVP